MLSLSLPLTACVTSNKAPVAVAPILPPLPAKLETECVDPGVNYISQVDEAVAELGKNRLYAACSVRKHRDIKKFYSDVRTNYGKK